MRHLLFATVITVAAGVAGLAAGAAPRVGSLPKGGLGAPPSLAERPGAVPAAEKVDGIHPALPPDKQRAAYPQGTRHVTIYGSAAEAAKHEQDGFVSNDPGGDTTACFTVADYWFLKNASAEWPASQGSRASLHSALPGTAAARQYQQTGPQALHVERLVLEGDRASLRYTDAWLDPATLGVRRIGDGSMALAKVADGPGGVRVFAARDEAQDTLHFVVHAPLPSGREASFLGRHFMVLRGGMIGSSDCGFARLSLRNAPGAGESGSVQIEVLLPGEQRAAAKTSERPVNLAGGVLAGLLGKGSSVQPAEPREIRVRTLMVHMSVSQGAASKEPVSSVSFGWQGRERRMQVF